MIDQTLNSRFYYPVVLHTGGVAARIEAPFVADLGEPFKEAIRVLSLDKGRAAQGMYVCAGGRWTFALPMVAVSEGVIIGYDVDVYIDVNSPVAVPDGARVFRNGQELQVPELDPGNEVWVILRRQASGGGSVTSVNNVLPDSSGNVKLPENYELSVSVPYAPTQGDSVFFQNIPHNVQYKSGTAVCFPADPAEVVLAVTLDGTPAGNITYSNGVGVMNLTLTTVTAGQVLEVVAETVNPLVTKIAFNLVFERT